VDVDTPTLPADTQPAAGSAAPARVGGELLRGDRVGRFIVLDRLGHGGMGVVHAAFDPELDRKVALKLVLPERDGGAHARARLLREAQAMARLAHPNVVAVHDVGTIDDRVWIAMEYVRGRTLTLWLAEARRSWRQIVDMFAQAGEGLRAAHEVGLVHRDFKPDNVMIGDDGRARVMDFGLARAGSDPLAEQETGEPRSAPLVTQLGAVVGTPRYMAPEQWQGCVADAQADQFAFCVALWEALYGQLPFAADGMPALVMAMLAGEIRHAKYCDSKAQAPAVAAELAKRAARDTDDRFRRLANQIRRSGIVKCSQEDLAELVRRGLLSVNDAMNTDG